MLDPTNRASREQSGACSSYAVRSRLTGATTEQRKRRQWQHALIGRSIASLWLTAHCNSLQSVNYIAASDQLRQQHQPNCPDFVLPCIRTSKKQSSQPSRAGLINDKLKNILRVNGVCVMRLKPYGQDLGLDLRKRGGGAATP